MLDSSSGSTSTRGHRVWATMAICTLAALGALPACRPDMKAPPPGVDPDIRPRDGGGTSDARDGAARDGTADAAPPVDAPGRDGVGGADAPGSDGAAEAPSVDAPPVLPDLGLDLTPPPPDLPPDGPVLPPVCGAEAPNVSEITNLDALTIGRDGTIYFAQGGTPDGWIGRLRPGGMAAEPRWLSVPRGALIWGLVTDDARQRLYVSSASGHLVHYVALGAATPSLQVLSRDVHEPDDLAIGPGGQIYFPDSDNHLYRLSPGGELERVTTRTFGSNRAAGLVFAPNGELLVATLGGGPIYRLGLAAGSETSRVALGTFRGAARSLVLDSQGALLVINQVTGADSQLMRIGADGNGATLLATGAAFTGLAFGRGALSCNDLYLASKTGPLRKVTTSVPGPRPR